LKEIVAFRPFCLALSGRVFPAGDTPAERPADYPRHDPRRSQRRVRARRVRRDSHRDRRPPPRSSPGAYGESYFPLLYLNWAPLRSIQDERWKFIDAPAPELYDLQRPQSADAQAGYGSLLAARGNATQAIDRFNRALAIRPDADDIRLDLARTLEQAGRMAEAKNEYARLAAGAETPEDIRNAAKVRLK
jgi:tetratricopeptide (TPR) repeat protein